MRTYIRVLWSVVNCDILGSSVYDASQLDNDDIGIDPQASASGVTGHSDTRCVNTVFLVTCVLILICSPPELEDEGSRIMLIELQEEQLIEYYMTLPGLG